MNGWVWLVIVVVAVVGIYLWRQYQVAQAEVEQMIDSGDFLNDVDVDIAYSLGMGAMNQGNSAEAMQAFRRAAELGHADAAIQLDLLQQRESASQPAGTR